MSTKSPLPCILACALLAACLPLASVVAGEDAETSYLSPPEVMKIAEESEHSYAISTFEELEELDTTDLAAAFWPSLGGQLDYPWISTGEAGKLSLSQYPLGEGCLALLEEAEPLFQAKEYEKAAEIYARATKEAPDCYVAVSHLGDCHFFRGRHDEALTLYQQSIDLNPYDFLGHFYKGNALSKLGRPTEAREAYVQALARRPHRESVVKAVRAHQAEFGIQLRDEPFQPRAYARQEEERIGVYFDTEAAPYWLAWGLCKAVWIGEPEIREARVGSSEHAWTLTEERQCLLTMLESYFAQREAEGIDVDPEMERILQAMEDDLLDGFVLYEIAYRHFPHSTILLPESLFDEVVRYVDRFVVAENSTEIELNCPDCHAPLTQEDHDGIQLDVCDRCQGLWFDRGELQAYWAASNSAGEPPTVEQADPAADTDGKPLACPACKTDTLDLRWVDVFIGGSCPSCHGVWLTPARGNKIPADRSSGKTSGSWLNFTNIEIILDLLVRHFR